MYEYIPICKIYNEEMTQPLCQETFQLFFTYFNRNVNENTICEFILQKRRNSVNDHLTPPPQSFLGTAQYETEAWEILINMANLQTQNYRPR